MAEKTINPMVKFALEFGPVLLFFVAYTRLKENTYTIGGTEYDGFIVVTAAFVPLLLASIAILWKLTGKISRMQVLTVPLTSEGWMILTKRLTFAFAALAIANEVVWRTMSTDAWVKIETFGFPVALFVFFMLQTNLFQKYSSEEQDEA